MSLHFEWDKHKAATNFRKHRVSSDEDEPFSTIRSPASSTIRLTRRMNCARLLLVIHWLNGC